MDEKNEQLKERLITEACEQYRDELDLELSLLLEQCRHSEIECRMQLALWRLINEFASQRPSQEYQYACMYLTQTKDEGGGDASVYFSYKYSSDDLTVYQGDEKFEPNLPGIICLPQFRIGPYRVDFLLIVRSGWASKTISRIVIECDGHDFHEKTKEQVARDKKRDRYLKFNGYDVVRYAGSEIWYQIGSCIHELEDFLNERQKLSVKPVSDVDYKEGAA